MRLIYVSPVPWNSLTQRPHEFVDYFRKVTDGEVLWIDPYPTRLPAVSDFSRARSGDDRHARSIPDWLTVISPAALPVEPIPVARLGNSFFFRSIVQRAQAFSQGAKNCALVIGKPSRLALQILKAAKVTSSCYDAMDDFPAFYSGLSQRSMQVVEDLIAGRVSKLITSSSNLVDKFRRMNLSAQLIRNACRENLPARVPSAAARRPLLGYVGTLGNWFDWTLLARLGKAKPECDFHLIGPNFRNPSCDLPSNVTLFPPVEHTLALKRMAEFDIGLIPFAINKLTASVDPIKYYEYRGIGLPVISSGFGEMLIHASDPGVFLIDHLVSPADLIDRALAFQSSSFSENEFTRKNCWAARFAEAKLFA